MAILLGVHNHLVEDGKWKESLEETRRFIIEEVDRMHDVKMFAISLNASKTFLARHLLDDYSDGKMEFFKGEQMEQI